MPNLSFLHSLEVAEKFVVEVPGVESNFSVIFGPRPKLNNKSNLKGNSVLLQDLEV